MKSLTGPSPDHRPFSEPLKGRVSLASSSLGANTIIKAQLAEKGLCGS